MEKNNVIYLAGAIRGDPSYRVYFKKIINIVENYAESRTELSDKHVPSIPYLIDEKYKHQIYERDIEWIKQSKAVIAETSGASTGVGYEIAYAIFERKIPILCLYNEKSFPSLMIAQNNEKYIFTQEYTNESDLELFIKIFLYVIDKFTSIDERRVIYKKIINNLLLHEVDIKELHLTIEKILLKNSQKFIETTLEPKKIKTQQQVEFSNAEILIEFLLKSLILQRKWINLKSQRLGETYISGRKIEIIIFLSKYNMGNISSIYKDVDMSEVNYTEWAFKKNLRAYRLIGLINSIYNLKYGSTKLKDKIFLQETLSNSIKLQSTTSKRHIIEGSFYTTEYIYVLSNFIRRFKKDFLENLLKRAMKEEWFEYIPDYEISDIDELDTEKILLEKWAIECINYLKIKTEKFYATAYSSYYKRYKPPKMIVKVSKLSEI